MDTPGTGELVIGLGEVGAALRKIFECDGHDPMKDIKAPGETYRVLHIAFPYSDRFVSLVAGYQMRFKPELTIIHSTVPVGTSRQLSAVHSPVRGIHPHLEEGIRTFVKYVGGENAKEAADVMNSHGLDCCYGDDPETAEALKLWDTTIYGINIMLEKEIFRWCEEKGLPFNVIYSDANRTYNQGYAELGRPEFKKYVLEHRPGPIGGHCIMPNIELLDSEFAKNILCKPTND